MSARPTRPEIMDDPAADPRDIAEAFSFIRWVNRRLGGVAGLLTHLEAMQQQLGRSIRMLDVGTGCADIPLAALEWAEGRGLSMQIVGVDLFDASLDEARRAIASHPITRAAHAGATCSVDGEAAASERGALDAARSVPQGSGFHERSITCPAPITLLKASAFELESHFAPRSFDVVHAGMFLHHFTDDQVVELLAIMGRLASKLVIWNDLSRDWLSRLAVRCLTLPLPRMVRHDAVLSVDKGFLPSEIRQLAGRAHLPEPRIARNVLGGRFSAVISVRRASSTPRVDAHRGLDSSDG
ncbi:MAG: hypothetical protein KF724_12830 [Phycisphaeraceae bacterium]|nr:hypothetical protein [Phycisphaeraceae bacterium]